MKNEENSTPVKEKKKYDPRTGYEFVPAWLILSMMGAKVLSYLSPYYAAMFLSQENIGLIMSIRQDDAFNMILATLVGYFIREKIGNLPTK